MSSREIHWGHVLSLGLLAAGCSKPEASKESSASPAEGMPAVSPTSEKDCCMGKNACKGQGGCAVPESHACMGKNDCKGKGGCNMHCKK